MLRIVGKSFIEVVKFIGIAVGAGMCLFLAMTLVLYIPAQVGQGVSAHTGSTWLGLLSLLGTMVAIMTIGNTIRNLFRWS